MTAVDEFIIVGLIALVYLLYGRGLSLAYEESFKERMGWWAPLVVPIVDFFMTVHIGMTHKRKDYEK